MGFRSQLNVTGERVDLLRIRNMAKICSRDDVIANTRNVAGLYWISTNMPILDIQAAIKESSGRVKKTRKTKPDGVGFTVPDGKGIQIIYSGTGGKIQSRLLQHLLDEGHEKTVKLSLKIDNANFSDYDWYLSTVQIKDYPSRYAIEAWWRLNKGWPPFCLR